MIVNEHLRKTLMHALLSIQLTSLKQITLTRTSNMEKVLQSNTETEIFFQSINHIVQLM